MLHTVSRNLWTDHVLGWWNHKDDPNVLFLKYEDLQKVCWIHVCIFSCSGLLVYSEKKGLSRTLLAIAGVFPNDWKNARVSPLYKNSGKRNDPSNYRPISVIPVVAKVFDRIIYDQLYVHLTKYNLLSKHQSGFRSLHSTVTAPLEATDSWALNIDRGLINAVVFPDLKKAFATFDHEILLSKLRSYGIRGLALRLFRSYLVDRTQICQIDCSKPTPKFLNCGVPEGTILGLLLFLLYINDLPQCLNFSHPRMYADDTSITYAGQDLNEIDDYLKKDLKSVNTWLSSNKLTLNLTKTEFLIITLRQRRVYLSDNPSLTINNFPIEQVSSTKSLGVSIDENLSWNTHIETVCKKISSALGLIKRIRDFVPF